MSSADPARSHSFLFARWDPERPYRRADLVRLARAGLRGLRLSGIIEVSLRSPERSAHVLQLLRDAAGSGLRVYWEGTVDGIDRRLVGHLDPPRSPAGPAWPVPRSPYLRVRHGPGFLIIEDQRPPLPSRRVVEDPAQVAVLLKYAVAQAPEEPLPSRAAAALDILVGLGWVTELGKVRLSLPVRFRYSLGRRDALIGEVAR